LLPGALAASISFLLHIFLEFSWNFPGAALFFFLMLGIAVGKYENNSHNTSKRIFNINLNYKTTSIVLVLILIFTFWHYASLEILNKGSMLIEEDNNKALYYIELGNKIYPINSIGYKLESDLYYQKYLDNKKIEDLYIAIEKGKKSVKLTPYKWDLHYNLGMLYLKIEDYIKAEEEFLLAVDYSAYSITPHLEVSKLYNKIGMPEKAKDILIQGLRVSEYTIRKAPTSEKPAKKIEVAYLHKNLAEIYYLEGNTELYNYHYEKNKKLLKEAFDRISELLKEKD